MELRRTRSTIGDSEADVDWTALVAAGDVFAVLRKLNARTRFRFTGVYRVDPPFLYNVHLYDRENPDLNLSGGQSVLGDTYCAFVADNGCPFTTPDSSTDCRLDTHAARERVQSYCGVPIRSAGGLVWGTLCHHDVRPRLVPRPELGALEYVASLLAVRLAGADQRI